MAGQTPRRPSTYTVPCRCGTYHIVQVSAFGRAQTCNRCRSGFTVVWKKNPKTGVQAPYVIAAARRTSNKAAPSPESLIQITCNCGYRRKVTADQVGKLPTCPGCGQPMYLDRPPRQKSTGPLLPPKPFIEVTRYAPPARPSSPPPPKPARSAPKSPASAPKTASARMAVMACTVCGERLLVHDTKQGRLPACLRCDGPMEIQAAPPRMEAAAFERDPDPPPTKRIPKSAAPEPSSPPPSKRLPRSAAPGASLVCPCGESIDMRGARPDSVFTCPACGRNARMQRSKHPQTLQTLLKPVFDAEAPEPEPTVAAEPGSLEILCECGEALVVSQRDVGHPVQCPGCSMLVQVESTPGGLKVKPMGKIDEQTWSWQDFS